MTRKHRSTNQSSISHILKPLAAGLLVFVLYQAWIKPIYLTSPSPSSPPRGAPAPSLELTVPTGEPRGPMFVPRTRTIELGEAPSAALGLMRDELEKGNVRQAEMALKKRSKPAPPKPKEREYLAALWNNLGIQQERYGGVTLSVHAFEEAVKLAPRNPTAHMNLTQAYWELRHPAMTAQFLESVIRLAPEDPFPHLALADLLLDQGHAPKARVHLDQAKKGASLDSSITSYLHNLTARAATFSTRDRSTVAIVSSPNATTKRPQQPAAAPEETARVLSAKITPPSSPEPTNPPQAQRQTRPSAGSAHFAVQYEGNPDETAWARMRAILEYAFDEITPKFGHVPPRPFTVVLHTGQQFAETAGTPLWADNLFDQSTGTIHVPAHDALEDLALFSRVVRHEFVHALLFDYLKGQTEAVPSWLIEGLALQLAEDPWPNLEKAIDRAPDIIPLAALAAPWRGLSPDEVPFAYIEAGSAVQHLADRYSVYNVRQIITLLRTGLTLDAAMRKKLSVSYEEFLRQWGGKHETVKRQG